MGSGEPALGSRQDLCGSGKGPGGLNPLSGRCYYPVAVQRCLLGIVSRCCRVGESLPQVADPAVRFSRESLQSGLNIDYQGTILPNTHPPHSLFQGEKPAFVRCSSIARLAGAPRWAGPPRNQALDHGPPPSPKWRTGSAPVRSAGVGARDIRRYHRNPFGRNIALCVARKSFARKYLCL